MDKNGSEWVFEGVREELSSADYTIANLESPAGIGGAKYCEKRVYFKANPKHLDALTYAGIDMVSLANNHALDYGPDILRQTMEELDKRKIKHIGIVPNRSQKNEATIVDIKGVKVAFLGYCNACPTEFGPRSQTAGVSVGLGQWIRKQVAETRAKGADFIVAMPHWGSEYFGVDKNQRYTANVMREAGVDVIVGAHPHVLQQVEFLDKTLVAWSLGNFLFPMRWQISLDSAILLVELEKGKKPKFDTIPISLDTNRPIRQFGEDESYARINYITKFGYQYNNERNWPNNGPWESK
jgi:poly-gamma-glutamate synthesis protein (capsule biosynthesis protein)